MTKGGLSDGHCARVYRTKNYMRHYYDCTSRLFSDGRADIYLNELFLNAAKNGDYERVQNFLARTSRNASVNVDAKTKDGGFTAVMLAAMNEHRKVVSLLLNYGADITLCNNKGQSVLDFASDSMRPLLLGSVARQGYSSRHLLQAAWQGNVLLVKKLLSSKSMLDVNCTNADGLTPLLLVTRDLNLFEKIEKAVMDSGYHPVEVVKELINHNADCGAKDSEGKRPLHLAAYGKGGHARDVVDVLIEKGATEIDVPDRFCNSPLHWATKEDNQPILLALIKGGANVNAKGHIGRTPLHIAASHGYEKSSDTLLYHGADVTITDDNGLSPVDVAKGTRVQVVLKDAWAEQTKDNKLQSKRVFLASVPPHVQQDPEFTEQKQSTEQETTVRMSTAPLQAAERRLKKRSKSSLSAKETTVLDERTNVPVSRKMSDVRMPRIPSAQKTELLSPGSRSNSGFASRVQSGKHELPEIKDMQTTGALPSLSVLNIELRYAR
ncbi:serine/threonine-protein phosphatase 6 regulatory ankyrin repeat subunit C-like isoform X2 [Orbicella faveolata]|uniref:serine/threonine-protein phosphatase 6 regulatory ankyrin repeat subunit C-like isoform X2 n=1 Tax=Orbicella faveolata TaxID=48498 RepID=UPI0009E5C81A|nr:serine/threonine-protein phosphatase 6 regulatory ankyrin repeat subunit C-like isoform X2 [Orbicella faveolata]